MICKPTVLILGAGASHPYGFPLGIGLVDKICREINSAEPPTAGDDRQVWERLASLGHDPGRINHFANELRRARPYSLDAFLETRQEFRAIGKAAIADVLLRAEALSCVDTAEPEIDWYRYLINKFLLLRNPDYFRTQAKLLTIVTFNFDRSFEWVLFERIRGQFGLSEADACALANDLPVLHVHGTLGVPRWLNPGLEVTTAYGALGEGPLTEAGPIAADGIKIVDEEIDQKLLAEIYAALRAANFVYFIGFGFDERNLTKLGTPESVAAALVRGTVLGWTAAEQGPVVRHFRRGGDIKIHLHLADARAFISNYAEALFD